MNYKFEYLRGTPALARDIPKRDRSALARDMPKRDRSALARDMPIEYGAP